MPSYLDTLDCSFGWNGDLDIDSGDIKTTKSDLLQSTLDQIHLEAKSETEDWEIYKNKGANLDDFIGEPNTRRIGNSIRDRLTISVVSSEIVNKRDLSIRVVPVHINRVLILITINAVSTPYNRLRYGEKLQTAIIFDSSEKQVFFLDKTPVLINNS